MYGSRDMAKPVVVFATAIITRFEFLLSINDLSSIAVISASGRLKPLYVTSSFAWIDVTGKRVTHSGITHRFVLFFLHLFIPAGSRVNQSTCGICFVSDPLIRHLYSAF